MSNLPAQKQELVRYFTEGCKPQGKLTLGVEVEHFVTHTDGSPVTFEEVQRVMQEMQGAHDTPVYIDGLYMGYHNPLYSVSLEPACQLEISIVPETEVDDILTIYQAFDTALAIILAGHSLQAYTVGYHPTRKAEQLPLIPKKRYQAMDAYFQKSGSRGIQMMRATASTQVCIDYYSEKDCVRKFRAACLLSPLFVLLTDNATMYQGLPNHTYGVRTHVWQDVDHARCGIPPSLMDETFGFDSYAELLLNTPLIVASRDGVTEEVGSRTAPEVYGPALSRNEMEHILSMVFFDVRLKSYLEIRVGDSMPAPYIAAYVQLIRAVFSSPAALEGVLRHYAGATVGDIEAARQAVCAHGYGAMVYGRPIMQELAWLLAQSKSRLATAEERRLLDPFIHLVNKRKTIREEDNEHE